MQKINKNTCPAFFLSATIDPVGSYSPCTALGGGAYKFENQSFKSRWTSSILEDARKKTIDGEKLDICGRCWNEESVGFTSEREWQIKNTSQEINYTDSNYYFSGPRNLNIKVSNICNLRCRTCQSKDSYLYHIEGAYYEKKNNLTNTPYTEEKFKKHFNDEQLDELYQLSGNLEKIELFGGEPMLDDQVPKFLLRLVDEKLSQNIDLKISTNATHKITDKWKKILTNFKKTIVNISVDGLEDKFSYMRHPGDWKVAENNIKEFIQLSKNFHNVGIVPVITVSALNIWNVVDIFMYFWFNEIEPFIIMVQWPNYYCVNVLPEKIKLLVQEKLINSFVSEKFEPLIKLMYTEPTKYNKISDLTPWEEFKFWTKEKDEYRNENFIKTFSEFGNLLIEHNEW